MKRAALYVRVSTDEQAQNGTSLEFQRETLERYCRTEGLEIAGIYEDDGYSGSSTDRPALQRLLKDAEQKKFDLVIVTKLDRFSRSLGDAPHLIIRYFGDKGIGFKSLTEGFDTSSPQGNILLGTLSGFADFERQRIRERSMDGKRKRASQNCWVMSFTPLGYRKDENRRLVADPVEAKLYERLVQWCLNGESTLAIARKLNALGIPTKHTALSRKGKKYIWKAGTIHCILTKPFYYSGERMQWGSKLTFAPLISKSRWDRVQAQLRRNFNNAQRNTKRFYLLRGLLKCKKCGRNIYGLIKESRGMRVYCCMSKRADPDPRWCGLKNVNIDALDAMIWTRVSRLIKDSKTLLRAIEASRLEGTKDLVTLEAQLTWVQKELKKKDAEMDRALGLYTKAKNLSLEDLDRHVGSLKSDREIIQADTVRLEQSIRAIQQAGNASRTIQTWAQAIAAKVDTLSLEKRRELLQTIIQRITIDWNESEKIHYIDIEGAVPLFSDGGKGDAWTPANSFKLPLIALEQ